MLAFESSVSLGWVPPGISFNPALPSSPPQHRQQQRTSHAQMDIREPAAAAATAAAQCAGALRTAVCQFGFDIWLKQSTVQSRCIRCA